MVVPFLPACASLSPVGSLGDAPVGGEGGAHAFAQPSVAENLDAGTTVCPSCPLSAPEAGAPCTGGTSLGTGPALCEYGDDLRSACNTVASCGADARWVVQPPDVDAGCPSLRSSFCPPTFAAGADAGIVCTAAFACDYPEGICGCGWVSSDIDGGLTYGWTCAPQPALCPSTRPRWGTACATEGLQCAYSGPCYTPPFVPAEPTECLCGTWQRGACPVY